MFTKEVDRVLKEVCLEIENRYEIDFIEIATDKDHVHFLVQAVPTWSPTKIVRTIKSITAKEVLKRLPYVKKKLWGAQFWTSGYYINTVGKHGNETRVQRYIANQGREKEYSKIHGKQIVMFDPDQ